MTSDMTGIYNLQKISGSVLIGNGQTLGTHKGLQDMVCIQRNGSIAKDSWEIKVVPQLNHDLFSFASAMKDGWQISGRWKKTGIEIEFYKKEHDSFQFDRIIPSGSSWLMGVQVKRIIEQARSMI